MIKVVTFDLDDTLWDVRPALIQAEEAQNKFLNQYFPGALETLGDDGVKILKRSLLSREPDLRHNISLFRQTFLEALLLFNGVGEAEAKRGAALAFKAFIAERHKVALFEHSDVVLAELRQKYTLGALTNGNADVFATPLGRYFNFAFKAEEFGAGKPLPDMYHAALKTADCTPDELVHVGDSHEADIEGAINAGVRSVWLSDDQYEGRADRKIRCISELPAALASLEAES